jgi:hypothetical protein
MSFARCSISLKSNFCIASGAAPLSRPIMKATVSTLIRLGRTAGGSAGTRLPARSLFPSSTLLRPHAIGMERFEPAQGVANDRPPQRPRGTQPCTNLSSRAIIPAPANGIGFTPSHRMPCAGGVAGCCCPWKPPRCVAPPEGPTLLVAGTDLQRRQATGNLAAQIWCVRWPGPDERLPARGLMWSINGTHSRSLRCDTTRSILPSFASSAWGRLCCQEAHSRSNRMQQNSNRISRAPRLQVIDDLNLKSGPCSISAINAFRII